MAAWRLLHLTCALGTCVSACTTPPQRPAAKDSPTPTAGAKVLRPQSRANRLVIHVDVEPLHLNPLADPDEWCLRIAQGTIFEPLASLGDNGQLVAGGLSSSVELSPSRLTYTFVLREGAKWHDGSPVRAADVAGTYYRILDPKGGLPALRHRLRDVSRVQVVDERTARLTMTQPNAFLPAVIAEIPVLPRASVAASEKGRLPPLKRGEVARRPVGSGPYRLDRWKRGQEITLVRNEDYPGAAARIERLVFVVERDGAEALASLRRGELDILPRVLPVHWPKQALTPAVKAAYQELRLEPRRAVLLLYNADKKPFDEPKVRRALDGLIDRERLVREARHGLGGLDFAPLTNGTRPAASTAEAIRLLDEVNIVDTNGDGLRELPSETGTAGRPFKLKILRVRGAAVVDKELEILDATLQKVGIGVEGVEAHPRELTNRLRRGAFDLALVSYAARPNEDPQELVGSGGALSVSSLHGAAELFEGLRRMPRGAEREALWSSLHEQIREQMPVSFLYTVQEAALVHKSVVGAEAGREWFDLSKLRLTDASKNSE